MSSNNNDDKTDKISLNKETNTASLNEDLLEKQNIKTKKNKQNTKKNDPQKQKEQDKVQNAIPETLSQGEAISVLIQAAEIGQQKGIYSFEEAALIYKAIKTFVQK